MTYRFVMATFEPQPGWANDPQALGAPLAALARPTQDQFVVVHIVWEGDDPRAATSFALYVSLANGSADQPPQNLDCWLAYSNTVAWCDSARSVGMPIVEASIAGRDHPLSVAIEAPRY